MECKQIGTLTGGKWDKMHECIRRVYDTEAISPTITSGGGGHHEVKILVREATKKGYAEATIGDGIDISYPESEKRRGRVQKQMSHTIKTDGEECVLVWDGYNQRVRKEQDTGGTITQNVGADLKRNGQGIIEQGASVRVRKLTPKECWRLMGFDDEDIDRAKAVGTSDTQLYKQAGNSIVVDVLCAIFKQML